MKTITRKELQNILGTMLHSHILKENLATITFTNGSTLWSYHELVAAYTNDGMHYFTQYHDYSITTSKDIKKYCGYNSETRRKMLEDENAYLII